MKNNRTRKLSQRVRYALIAGMAGVFLIPQVGYAGPTGEHDYTSGVNVDRNTANTTKITSTATNNVINWRDYSVNKGETVQYDGGVTTGATAHNYLNIVTGANTSNIDGKIKGGNHVYIVNPNGVIFGKNAEVNVGHLHVSTQDGVADAVKTAFKTGGTSPLDNTAALKSDVVNMGTIKADTVEVHGAHIRFLNAKNVQTSAGGASPVVNMYTAAAATSATDPDGGYAHIGYRGTAPTNYTSGTTGVSPEYYQLVKDKTELDAINTTNLAGKYMLENDIDLGGAAHTPIGGNAHSAFTGKFDGNFFRVQNFTVSGVNSAGLFGEVSGGRIENVGVSQATITGKRDNSHCYAGGIAGHTTGNSVLKNVYAFSSTMVEGRKGRYGGIVGATDHTLIDSAYSKALIGTDGSTGSNRNQGGGIIGLSADNTDIRNTYSAATNSYDGSGAYFVYIIDPDDKTTITNSYAVTGAFSSTLTGLEAGKAVNTYRIDQDWNATPVGLTGTAGKAKVSDRYAGWDINNDGAPGAKWRIYEGRTLPLLTAFMNGRVDSVGSVGANYSYRKFNQADGSVVDDPANKTISNNHADITELTYDSKIVKIVDGAGNAGNTSNVTYDKTLGTTANIYTYTDTGSPQNKKENIRNAGTKAILWSDQDGPNLRNVNVTIKQRKVSVEGSNLVATRRYNGTKDVTDAFVHAIQNGGITTGGFTPEDLADHSVEITVSTDFKAEMADKNAGDGKEVTFKGKLTFSGSDQSNYDIGDFDFTTSSNTAKGTANITKAPLILKVTKDSTTKVYDGTDAVTEAAMSADPNIKLDETLRRTGETDAADIKSDETHKKDDVSINYASIGSPTYINSTTGAAEVHAGTHKIRYKNVELQGADKDNYELYYQMPDNTQKKVASNQIDLKGEITRRRITTNDFKVYEKGTNAPVEATKIYDGNNEYAPTNVYLSTDENGATGIVRRDKGYITFAMKDGKGHFIDNDTSKTQTKNVKEATRVSYTVTGVADSTKDTDGQPLYRLSDYYVLDADGVTKNDLDVGFDATGAGRITPKLLTANVVKNHIEKTYDGWADQTDGNRNKTVGDPLVTLSGWVAGDTARTNTSTATYASPNVAWDDTNKREQAQNVTYNVSFARGSDADSDNYILDSSTSVTDKYTLTLTQDGSGNNYTGTIKRREVALTMGPVDKIYDGTAANKKSDITSVAGKMGGTNDTAILNDDGITTAKLKTKHEQMMAAGTATSSFGRGTGAGFTENVNASNGTEHDVRYQNIEALFQAVVDAAKKNNYKVDDTVYGKGTINRRLIEKSGFQVRDKDDGFANATKVYDGTSTFALKNGETLVAKTAATGSDTGVVDKDKDNIYFTMTGENGHFTSDAAGTNRTSHKSEANYVAYDVVADTHDGDVSPLSNYFFGTSDTSKRNLEEVNAANPDAVTADGSIRSAKIQAQTKEITKVYDGMQEHTDDNRNVQHGDSIVGLNLIADASGQPTNTSTAAYADKNVARDTDGTIIKKAVNYTAQITGKYADDYEIVDAGNNVISSVNGTGDSKTVTATRNNVADMGKITPRTLNITMSSVSKVYDTGSANTATNNTAVNPSGTVKSITDEPSSAVIGDILRGDGITKDDLGAAWRALRDHGDAVSDYGHKGNTPFEDENASAAPEGHDVRYRNMDTAFKNQYGLTTAGNYTVASDVYGKGTITPKALDPNKFSVEDANGHAVPASKTYDGTSDFTVDKDWKIRPSTGSGTGLFDRDANRVKFALSENGAYFIDKNGNKTAHASNKGTAAETDTDAVKASYHVTASADPGYEKLLKNYTLNGKTLDSGEASVTGKGTIKRRELSLDLVWNSDINKTYDGTTKLVNGTKNWNALTDTDTNGNVKYVDGTTAAGKLVSGDGTSFHIESNYMSSAPVLAPDKNVRRDGTGQVISKDILYKIILNGDAANYSFNKGGTVTNAESGLELSATGKIEPKDISGAFKKVTKVYDRTKNVPTGAVGLDVGTAGGVISGDVVTLKAGYGAVFESPNVKGSGTSRVIGGETQHNWVNYTNVELDGTDAGNYKITSDANGRLYGLGEITPLALDADKFKVDGTDATKAYDGTSAYQLGGKKLMPTGTGLIGTDADHIKFETEGDGKFTDNSGSETPNAYEATKVSYNVKAKADNGHERLLGNYTLNGKTLESNDPIAVSGKGTITRRVLRLDLVQDSGIDKVYDGKPTLDGAKWNELQTTANPAGNVKYAAGSTDKDKLVKTDGTSFKIESNYRNDGDTANDKNVKYNGSAVDEKKIRYDITITGGDARNYSFEQNGVETDAENGLKLSATGKIRPKDLTRSFAKITKVYDGTTSVDHATNPTVTPAQVGFTAGAVIAGDDVTLATHNEAFQSKNVNGDGSTWTPTEGTEKDKVQKNWINYSGLTLGGADAGNYRIDSTAKGLGEITPLNINGNVTFTMKTNPAEKFYDGTRALDPQAAKHFIRSAVVNGTTLDILNDLDVDTATYQSTENATNGGTAQKVVYKMKTNDTLGNINITGDLTAEGDGIIKRRVLRLDLVQDSGIDKVYDGKPTLDGAKWNELQTTANPAGNVKYAAGSTDKDKLVKTDGTSFKIESNYRNDGDTANDKNVKYNGSAVDEKKIRYDITITGGDARNYSFEQNGVETDAENGLKLSATGKIRPKDLTRSFAKITKVYDGTTSVDHATNPTVTPAQVGFTVGTILQGDTVTPIVGHAAYQSANVNGDGSTQVIDGTAQKNWINYSGLALTGADARNYRIDSTAKGLGEITPLAIDADKFKVNGADAAKVYDGSSAYHLEAGKKLAPHAGLIGTDANNIEFEMDGDGKFTDDNGAEKSNTFDATRVSYKVKAKTGIGNERLLGNYTLNGKTLDSGTIGVSGKGTITRRTLNLNLVQNSGIEKVYDGNSSLTGGGRNWNALTETEVNGNVAYTTGSQKLVDDGTGLAITSNYVEGAAADQNVRRDGAGNVVNKDIRYDIAITGGDARNYFFEKNGVKTDAENGLTLTATGKITPKDLSGSFDKVRKTYDGTTVVAPNAVHFEKGAVIGDDDVDIQRTGTDAYTAEFESPNVDGSGTTWIAPDGTVQNNWVNYGNLKLTGAQAGNYQISPTARGLGEIIPLPPEPEFYIPNADYYNTLATNKMLPDEYAYENASLDRRSHFGRDAEAEVAYEPPSINIVQDGIDLSKSNIVVTDNAVFEIVNEVFG